MTADLLLDGACRLTGSGVIRARGDDAASFLQGQLTNDVVGLGPTEARLAGFCSAKGRLQASFIVWRPVADEFFLVCAADVLPVVLKRLSMFVLRAKCRLDDASGEVDLWGLVGASAAARFGDARVWERRMAEAVSLIRLPDAAGLVRGLVASPAGDAGATAALPVLAAEDWHWLDVQSGIVTIEAATVDRFVPQMVNFELVGGVDFQKGCYPGQEVVARSQYRGTTKRRTFLFDTDAVALPGQDVFSEGSAGEAAGTVANAAANPSGTGGNALVELRLAALASGGLHLGGPDGPRLVMRELPYAVPIDAAVAD